MNTPYLPNGEHFQVFQGIPINEMSPTMHEIGKSKIGRAHV